MDFTEFLTHHKSSGIFPAVFSAPLTLDNKEVFSRGEARESQTDVTVEHPGCLYLLKQPNENSRM